MRFFISSSRCSVVALALTAFVSSLGCNKLKAMENGGDGGSVTTTSSPGLASKALSLLGVGADAFEGDITMSMKSSVKATPDVIVYEVKGPKLRFNEPSGRSSGYVIFDTATRKATMVEDAKKQAIVVDLGAMADSAAAAGATAPTKPADDFAIDMSGGTDTVAGYSCDVWKITDKTTGHKTDACLAKGIGFPDMTMGMGGKKTWMARLVTERYFPLRAITTENGVEKERMEVTKIDKKTLPDSLFQVPDGYKIVDESEMMKAFGNMGAGMRPGANGAPPMMKPPHR